MNKFVLNFLSQGIYEGLKVFENTGEIDASKLTRVNPRSIARRPRKEDGKLIGWQKGLKSYCLLNHFEARWKLFIKPYKKVLESQLYEEVEDLRREINNQDKKVVFLDTTTNVDVDDFQTPLSAAYLLKCLIEDKWPQRN